jgi:predicted MFS family arabinose efflux permease
MVLSAAALGMLTLAHLVTPMLLLLFTFLIGFGAVLNDPAWQAITPEVVSHENFASGVALNSAGYNVARAVGPAIGGIIIAATSSGVVFLLNACSIFGVIFFLHRWKRHPGPTSMRADHMFRTMFDGFRYMRTSHTVKCVLVRSAVFSLCATALPALLPLLAHPFGSRGYGLLLAIFGLGAVGGATILPTLRHRMSIDVLVSTSTAIFAVMTYASGRWPTFVVLAVSNLIGGIAWIQILASLNVSAQTMTPGAMRARAISMYLLILQGGFAVGSALWGAVAERSTIERSLTYASLGLLVGIAATYWFRLHSAEIQPTAVGMD